MYVKKYNFFSYELIFIIKINLLLIFFNFNSNYDVYSISMNEIITLHC